MAIDEAARLAALRRYDILDTDPERDDGLAEANRALANRTEPSDPRSGVRKLCKSRLTEFFRRGVDIGVVRGDAQARDVLDHSNDVSQRANRVQERSLDRADQAVAPLPAARRSRSP